MTNTPLLEIRDISANVMGKPVLRNFSLRIDYGQTHAIMGPNGAGKSTLANVLAGHVDYEVTSGSITFMGKDLLALDPDERAHLGLFMGFQYPVEIPGVKNADFLEKALQEKRKYHGQNLLTKQEFSALLQERMRSLDISPSFATRDLNVGFSGGEKKKNELLQMALFQPKLNILDETDSGLDVDAVHISAKHIQESKPDCASLLITHYAKLLRLVEPDYVHIMLNGTIVRSGSIELCEEIEQNGYQVVDL